MWLFLPKLERVLDRSMMGLLLMTDRLANDRSAVTCVIEILSDRIYKLSNLFTITINV